MKDAEARADRKEVDRLLKQFEKTEQSQPEKSM